MNYSLTQQTMINMQIVSLVNYLEKAILVLIIALMIRMTKVKALPAKIKTVQILLFVKEHTVIQAVHVETVHKVQLLLKELFIIVVVLRVEMKEIANVQLKHHLHHLFIRTALQVRYSDGALLVLIIVQVLKEVQLVLGVIVLMNMNVMEVIHREIAFVMIVVIIILMIVYLIVPVLMIVNANY